LDLNQIGQWKTDINTRIRLDRQCICHKVSPAGENG
jgi:hypothetical protein